MGPPTLRYRIGWGYPLSGTKEMWMAPFVVSKRVHNPLLKEAGLTKPTGAHPSGGPVAGGAIGTSGMPLTA